MSTNPFSMQAPTPAPAEGELEGCTGIAGLVGNRFAPTAGLGYGFICRLEAIRFVL